MHFYHPNFLYGLLALIIPIIIHLFNFKKFKKVYFANLSFLKEVQQQSKRHSQLIHLVIMFLRMVFIAMIVLAFAGPYLSTKDEAKNKSDESYINIFLDNSFSMQARASEGSIFDEGRKIARQIALAHKPTDHFRLLNNEKVGFAKTYVNRDVFIDQLDKIQIDKSSISFSEIPKRLNDNSSDIHQNQDIYIISDFQKKQADIENIKSDSSFNLQLIPLEAAVQGNLFVDSVWIEKPVLQPDKNIIVNFEIENNSNQAVDDISISLKIGNKQKAVTSVSIDAFGKAKSSFNFRTDTAGFYGARIIVEDYPIVYDDIFYFTFTVEKELPVLCILGNKSNSDLKTYLNSDSVFDATFVDENQINYSIFQQYSSIILNGLNDYSTGLNIELLKYVNAGGNLVLIPNSNNSIDDINKLNSKFYLPQISGIDSNRTQMLDIDIESPEFSGVFDLPKNLKKLKDNTNLPYFSKHFNVSKSSKALSLIKDETSNTILNKFEIKNGNIFFFYTPIESELSNFSTHAIFVPIFFNILQNQHSNNQLYYYLGTDNKFETRIISQEQEMVLNMKLENDSIDFIPQYSQELGKLVLSFQQQPQEVGIYKLLNKEKTLAKIGFNYNRKESYLEYYSENELLKILKTNKLTNAQIFKPISGQISEQINESKHGIILWKLFIAIATIILIIELFLLRFSKY